MADTEERTSRGSTWRRWEPHIHAPGTVLNDQFKGPDPWEEYLARIETTTPKVVALGVTDYWGLELYEQVLHHKEEGRLSGVELIFPNVEIRFGIGTAGGGPINGHLLISPDDSEHVKQARRFLETLTFEFKGEDYRCKPDELLALGKAYDPQIEDDNLAIRAGANQFKVSLADLKKAFAKSDWARSNILVGVATGTNDGTAGLKGDASLGATRREIERRAEVIFSGNPQDRAFWLGEKADTIEQLRAKYDGAKPCLHGSDAHSLDAVCAPDRKRYTWIKGDPTFESLRQAVIEPGARVFVGEEPPEGALSYRVIESIELAGADWFRPERIELNKGLVGIIGARGSGKTALADLIATGARSGEGQENDRSFVHRAADYLDDVEVTIRWEDGESWSRAAAGHGTDLAEGPGVQYLSQQFVERLCSADGGVSDELLGEIERVIYEEHPEGDRLGAADFEELLASRASRSRLARDRSRAALQRAVTRMFEERAKKSELSVLKSRRETDFKSIAEDRSARQSLISKGTEERTKRLEEVQAELEKRQGEIDLVARRLKAIIALGDSVADARERRVDEELEDLRTSHVEAGLDDQEWHEFRRDFVGEVTEIVARHRADAEKNLAALMGAEVEDKDSGTGLLEDAADLAKLPRAPLAHEAARLRKLIGMDDKRARQLTSLDRKIGQAESSLAQLDERIGGAEASSGRIEDLREERKQEYGRIFDALVEEEGELEKLYAPLAKKLVGAHGALGKLTFEVRREVDLATWTERGETLLDLRKSGPFKGHGSLVEAARKELLPAWRSGTSAEVREAMAGFRENHDEGLLEHSPVPRKDRERFWGWAAEVANWLDDTSHITIRYGIQYDGVDIAQLSPGTRGIVLLLLYLTIDQTDDRPLIIDQPEENLDPKSVFDELVARFRETRLRRQMIVVTHNANLVVNTDADQIIVAEAGPHRDGGLPEISYRTGGLEDRDIRRQVCEILEGGQQAFLERARRLRVRFPQGDEGDDRDL